VTTSLQRPNTPLESESVPGPGDERSAAARLNGITRTGFLRGPRPPAPRGSRWGAWYAGILAVADLATTALGGLTSILASDHPWAGLGGTREHPYPMEMYLVGCLFLPLAWVLTMWGSGAYDRRYLGIGTDEFKRVIRGALIVVAVVSFVVMAFKYDISRIATATALVCALGYLLAGRLVARLVLQLLRRHGNASQRLLLVGTLPEAMEVFTAVTRNPTVGLVPIGIYLTEGKAGARGVEAPVPLHTSGNLVSLVRKIGADTIAVCGSAGEERNGLRRLAWQLEGTGIDLVVAPQLTDIAGPRVHIRPVEGLPLLHVEEPTISGLGWVIKNLMDRVAAGFGLLLLSPILAAIAIAIRMSDPGPVFFRQARVGREGEKFLVWKFRTMYTDAEERLAALTDQNETDGLLFKIRNDPRVTPIGNLLRRTSLDELPQLINVLKGEMSLVGPRPLPAEDGDFLGDVRRRMLVRPGITGLWQVSGRSDLSWDDAVRLDLYYVDNWSLTLDLLILGRTLRAVVARRGAY
jgi:exopolysaccharide biosynthesis polyprenyl glycosylphosphotransferase